MIICQIPYLMDFKIPPHADGIENSLFEGIHSHLQIPIPILKPNQTQESLEIRFQFHKIPKESSEPNAPLVMYSITSR